jgi:hypothetical protein
MLTVDHKQSLQLEVRFGGICSHPTAACALAPHLIGAFLSVTARGGAARIAQQRGGKGQVPEVLLLLLDETSVTRLDVNRNSVYSLVSLGGRNVWMVESRSESKTRFFTKLVF